MIDMEKYFQVGDIVKRTHANIPDDLVVGFKMDSCCGNMVVVREIGSNQTRSHCTIPGICGTTVRIVRKDKVLVFRNGKIVSEESHEREGAPE